VVDDMDVLLCIVVVHSVVVDNHQQEDVSMVELHRDDSCPHNAFNEKNKTLK